MMKDLKAIQEALASSKNIVITTHANPDADALGSSLGWMHYLRNKGLNAVVVTPTDYPDFLKWMPGNDSVKVFNKDDQGILELVKSADMIFCLDFSDLKRIDTMSSFVENSSTKKVIVDHHRHPQEFGEFMVHSTEAAATAELIYEMIEGLDGEEWVTKDIAECLYAGIMTDTGSFRHSNVNAKVLHISSRLVDRGANASLIAKLIYDNNSINRLRFLGYSLWELLKVDMKAGIGYFAISKEDAERFNLQSGDTEGLVNYALSIKGIKVAALFKEQDGIVKISFRSVGDIAVNNFAEKYFEGGGHLNAAGGRSLESLEGTVKKFKDLIKQGILSDGE